MGRTGCSAVVAHVLWEHEVVGSSPTTPTTFLALTSFVSLVDQFAHEAFGRQPALAVGDDGQMRSIGLAVAQTQPFEVRLDR